MKNISRKGRLKILFFILYQGIVSGSCSFLDLTQGSFAHFDSIVENLISAISGVLFVQVTLLKSIKCRSYLFILSKAILLSMFIFSFV